MTEDEEEEEEAVVEALRGESAVKLAKMCSSPIQSSNSPKSSEFQLQTTRSRLYQNEM